MHYKGGGSQKKQRFEAARRKLDILVSENYAHYNPKKHGNYGDFARMIGDNHGAFVSGVLKLYRSGNYIEETKRMMDDELDFLGLREQVLLAQQMDGQLSLERILPGGYRRIKESDNPWVSGITAIRNYLTRTTPKDATLLVAVYEPYGLVDHHHLKNPLVLGESSMPKSPDGRLVVTANYDGGTYRVDFTLAKEPDGKSHAVMFKPYVPPIPRQPSQ